MDELKHLIEESRELFDSGLPLAGHMDRFLEKLEKEEKETEKFNWTNILKVASVAILVVLSGLYIKDKLFTLVPNAPVAETSQEFAETKQYYVHMVDQRIGQLELLDNALTDEQRDMLTEEMSNMDNMYKKLQKDLMVMPNDPRIMQAMLHHYQMKMEVLNRIINDLNNVQQLNTPNHDESIEL